MSESIVSTPDVERSKRPASSPAENNESEKRVCESHVNSSASVGVTAGVGGGVADVAGVVESAMGPLITGLAPATIQAIANAVAMQIGPQIAKEVSDRVSQEIKKELSVLKGKVVKLTGEVGELRGQIESKDREIEDLKLKLDESEMYSRRSSVRLFNIPEAKDESTDDIVCRLGEALGADIFYDDIDRSHRVGRVDKDKPRPIICKFVSYQAKLALMRRKKKLKTLDVKKVFKTDSIYINEDLTKDRARLAKTARDLKKSGKILDTWTRDGVIFVKTPSEAIERITCNAHFRILDL